MALGELSRDATLIAQLEVANGVSHSPEPRPRCSGDMPPISQARGAARGAFTPLSRRDLGKYRVKWVLGIIALTRAACG